MRLKIMESNAKNRKSVPSKIVMVVVGILLTGVAQAAKPSGDIVTIDICPSTRAHFRNDWSLVFPLKQGRLMLAWCEYYATSPEQGINGRKSN